MNEKKKSDNIAIGIGVGLAIGVAIGIAMGGKKKK